MFIDWRLNIVSILSKWIYRFKTIPIRNVSGLLCLGWMGQAYSKIYTEMQRSRTSKTILKKRKVGGLVLTDFKTFGKTIVIKTARGFLGDSVVKTLTASARDTGSTPHLGGSHMLWSNQAQSHNYGAHAPGVHVPPQEKAL